MMQKPLRHKRIAQLLLATLNVVMLAACATPHAYPGATAGGVVGAAAGALVDRGNPWRGAVLGGLLGATLGGTMADISAQVAQEAARTGRPVAYRSRDSWQRVEAWPVTYDVHTRCHKVRERVWQNGTLVKDRIREVCRGERRERTY